MNTRPIAQPVGSALLVAFACNTLAGRQFDCPLCALPDGSHDPECPLTAYVIAVTAPARAAAAVCIADACATWVEDMGACHLCTFRDQVHDFACPLPAYLRARREAGA